MVICIEKHDAVPSLLSGPQKVPRMTETTHHVNKLGPSIWTVLRLPQPTPLHCTLCYKLPHVPGAHVSDRAQLSATSSL